MRFAKGRGDNMARYRQIHTEFWQDGFVLDLTPEEKYFYIYLMTNSKTTQCGIYELPKRIIETETGYNRETVDKLLQRFIDYGKIIYHEPTREIMIVNWIKYNWINSPKVLALIDKELKQIKNKEFVYRFIEICRDLGYRIDTLSIYKEYSIQEKNNKSDSIKGSIPYQYPINTVGIDLGEEQQQEQEKEQEIEKEKEEEQEKESVSEIIKFWDENGFGVNNIHAKNQLLSWLDDSPFPEPKSMILKAMSIACENNKRRLNYVEGILRNWINDSILTIKEVETKESRGDRNEFSKPSYELPVSKDGHVRLYK